MGMKGIYFSLQIVGFDKFYKIWELVHSNVWTSTLRKGQWMYFSQEQWSHLDFERNQFYV